VANQEPTMPHPQDVAVPSLPDHPEHNHSWSQQEAGAIRDFARAAVIADRAAGRASAEPEEERAE